METRRSASLDSLDSSAADQRSRQTPPHPRRQHNRYISAEPGHTAKRDAPLLTFRLRFSAHSADSIVVGEKVQSLPRRSFDDRMVGSSSGDFEGSASIDSRESDKTETVGR